MKSKAEHELDDGINGSWTKSPGQVDSLSDFGLSSCPTEFANFIEKSSLENLIFWKLQAMFARIDQFGELPPQKLLESIVSHVERPLLALVLRKAKYNQKSAADMLCINRNTLHRKLKQLGMLEKVTREAQRKQSRKNLRDLVRELV